MPIEVIGDLKEVYNIATPLTWTFSIDGIYYGGLEDNEFNNAQKNEIIALGGAWFSDAASFLQ